MPELVCVACPVGCRLEIERDESGAVAVRGHRCPRGEQYGREELLAPRRTLTSVVSTDSPDFPCAPVRTDVPLPRELVSELLAELYRLRAALPVRLGGVLLKNWRSTGVSVVFTRTLPPQEVAAPREARPEPEGDQQVALRQQAP